MVIVRAIDHTGIALADWLKPTNQRGGPAPKAAAEGPLKGERIALLGASRDGALAHRLAGAGGRVLASVGTSTTMLVVSADQPYGKFHHASPAYRRAMELRESGCAIEIVLESDLEARIGLADEASVPPS